MPQFPQLDPSDPNNMTFSPLQDPGWRHSDFLKDNPGFRMTEWPRFDHSVYPIPDADWERLGPRALEILEQILPEVAGRFAQKSLHYGDGNPDNLGPAGQFSDIWRKIGPLRRALWEGQELTQEPPQEILMDLIGHCLLTIGMLRRGVDRRGS